MMDLKTANTLLTVLVVYFQLLGVTRSTFRIATPGVVDLSLPELPQPPAPPLAQTQQQQPHMHPPHQQPTFLASHQPQGPPLPTQQLPMQQPLPAKYVPPQLPLEHLPPLPPQQPLSLQSFPPPQLSFSPQQPPQESLLPSQHLSMIHRPPLPFSQATSLSSQQQLAIQQPPPQLSPPVDLSLPFSQQPPPLLPLPPQPQVMQHPPPVLPQSQQPPSLLPMLPQPLPMQQPLQAPPMSQQTPSLMDLQEPPPTPPRNPLVVAQQNQSLKVPHQPPAVPGSGPKKEPLPKHTPPPPSPLDYQFQYQQQQQQQREQQQEQQREQQQEHYQLFVKQNPHRYEVDVERRKPQTALDVKAGSNFHNAAAVPQASLVYEYDLIEPDTPPTPAPVHNHNVVQSKAHRSPQLYRLRSPYSNTKYNYRTSDVYNTRAIQKPVNKNYPLNHRFSAIRKAMDHAARRRPALSRKNTPIAISPPLSRISRTLLDERQNKTPPLFSNYPLRTVVSAAAARGIMCKSLYDAYRLLPMASHPSYCGRGLSCPSPLIREIQVGRTCLCCSSFDIGSIKERRGTD